MKYPLKRTGDKGSGNFSRISWEEALDEIVETFSRVSKIDGPEAIWPYFFAGTMGLLQRDCIDLLRNVFGYSKQDMTICTTLGRVGWKAGTGILLGVDACEMACSDLIVVWGGNPVSTQVNVMTHISRARRERGAKLVVIDAYQSPTAEVADEVLLVQPGTDGAVASAVMHVLFRDGLADEAYMEKYTDNWRELREHLRDKTPLWAERISGVNARKIETLARAIGEFLGYIGKVL